MKLAKPDLRLFALCAVAVVGAVVKGAIVGSILGNVLLTSAWRLWWAV